MNFIYLAHKLIPARGPWAHCNSEESIPRLHFCYSLPPGKSCNKEQNSGRTVAKAKLGKDRSKSETREGLWQKWNSGRTVAKVELGKDCGTAGSRGLWQKWNGFKS